MTTSQLRPRAVGERRHRALVWDNHFCLPMKLDDNLLELEHLHRVHEAGIDVVSINAGFGPMEWTEQIRLIAQMRRYLLRNAETFLVALSVEDLKAAKRHGKLAVVFDIESAQIAESQLDLIQLIYDLGVRWMLIAYNRNNDIGGGCHDRDTGLTDLGRRVVEEMNRVGMVVCCSHTGYRTALEVMEHGSQPIVFSHSNPRSLHDHPRNIPDLLIRECAKTGGVIGLTGVNIFLGEGPATPQRLAEHVDYVADLVGIDHVGLSSDYAPSNSALNAELNSMQSYFPDGHGYDRLDILPPSRFFEVADALADRGYSADDISKVLGGNFLRVAETVWR